MTNNIKIETVTQALIELKKLQKVCRMYREENRLLKMELEKFRNFGSRLPDFMRGFAKK